MALNGETVKTWTHSSMIEPMCVAVDRIYDHVLIGDSSCNIHVFKATTAQHLFTVRFKSVHIYIIIYLCIGNLFFFQDK